MPRKAVSKPVEVDRSPRSYGVFGLIALGLLIVGGTILWARSDAGMIDVTATIANSQANRSTEAGVDDNTLPPQAPPEYASKPNGGLQAQGGEVSRPPEPEPVPVDTGTSTASTTDDGADTEDGTGEEEPTAPETNPPTDEPTDTSADTDTTTPSEGEGGGEAG